MLILKRGEEEGGCWNLLSRGSSFCWVWFSSAWRGLQGISWWKDVWSTHLLDYLIQYGSPPPSSSSIAPAMQSTSQSSLSIFIGALSTKEFIQQECNELVVTPFLAKHNAKKVTRRIRASLKAYTNATLHAASKLVAPMIYGNLFFVLVIECSGISHGFYKSLQCYDSLDTTKARWEVQGGRPEVDDFLEDYHRFLVD